VTRNSMRASSATPRPTSAQTIHEGKYEPRILRDGAPLQPASRPTAGARTTRQLRSCEPETRVPPLHLITRLSIMANTVYE
jgi:hypothetical protein